MSVKLQTMEQENGTFSTQDSAELYWQSWTSEDPKAINIYLHGSFSHSGEAKYLAKTLGDLGISTYSYDHRGWGRWDKKRGYVSHRSLYLEDARNFIKFVKDRHRDLPLILTAHSMGGLLVLRLLLEQKEEFTCAVVSGPWLGTRAKPSKLLEFLSGFLSTVWPTFTADATFKIDELTHDNAIIQKYHQEADEGIRYMKATIRWYVEMKKTQQEVLERCESITTPIMFLQGGQDLLVNEGLNKQCFDKISSEVKVWEYFPNFYHEVFAEKERHQSLSKAKSFIQTELDL